MAAAEARAAWQRTANRCFVQEDARSAPKLSCCSSSSTKSQSDGGVNVLDHATLGCPNPDLPNDIRWWFYLQPNFGHQKDFTHEHLNALEAELEVLSAGFINQTVKLSWDHQPVQEYATQTDTGETTASCEDQPWQVSATSMKNEWDCRMPELKSILSNSPKDAPKIKDTRVLWYPDDHLMNLDSFNSLAFKQDEKLSSDLESHWIGAEKTEPRWRTANKDELASLVAQKSLEHIENCDLPQPQTKHFTRGPSTCLQCFDHSMILASSLDSKLEIRLSNQANYPRGTPNSSGMNEKQKNFSDLGCSPHDSDAPLSSSNLCGNTSEDLPETQQGPDSDPSKAQLMEALRHSQTRARKAEEAVQQACTEKEHIVKLFFKQASQLFAYKQWFQLLQLENLCLQLKNKEEPISTLFTDVLPQAPHKSRRKDQHKSAKSKRDRPRYNVNKSAFAFVLGLSLAGAGLLLGWTMGWLFPPRRTASGQ